MGNGNYSAEAGGAENKYVFRLFISGMSSKSISAIEKLREMCDHFLSGNFDLEIIDVHQQGQAAVDYQILATPCLIKFSPLPKRIILGDLSDTQKLLRALDIDPDKKLGTKE